MSYKIPAAVPVENLRNLVSEMIQFAVEDFRGFEASGLIRCGKVVSIVGNPDVSEAREVLHFFKSDCLEKWLALASLNVSAQKIRAGLGFAV